MTLTYYISEFLQITRRQKTNGRDHQTNICTG